MDKKSYAKAVSQLIPSHDDLDDTNFDYTEAVEVQAEELADTKEQKLNASQLARIKLREQRELKKLEKQREDPSYGLTPTQLKKHEEEQEKIAEDIATVEAIEASPEAQSFLAGGNNDLLPYSGTTQRDVVKLLTSLNINLSLNLTRQDTYNLLGCLLTCNEAQLQALMANKKVPVAIKTVIKRLLDDMKLGNMGTVEALWDRIFGKADKASLSMPIAPQIQTQQGIIPNTVVSREAYVIIRDSIIGK